jgi:hypothetical protein
MKSRSLNRCLFRFAVLVLLSVLLASTVFADMGPHESVEITVEMPEGFRPFYATLLSKYPSTGPYSEGNWKHEYPDSKTYQTFDAYEDPDGYYFISYVEYCTDGSFSWGYMPPDDFKLLLYFPDTGELVCSEATTTFAFYSVYQATLKDGRLELKAVYNYGRQILSFLARLAVTLLLELGLAYFLGYQLKSVLIINLITQVGLNLVLFFLVNQTGGSGFFYYMYYIMAEFVVFAIEAVFYCAKEPKFSEKRAEQGHPVSFAFLANALSFGVGLLLNCRWPLIF